jgi:hypothetical protein
MQLHKNGYRKSDKKSVKSISLFLPLTFSFHFPSFPLRTRHFPFLVCPLRHNPIPLLSLATPFSLFNFFRFSLLPLLIDLLFFLIFIYLVLFFFFPCRHHTPHRGSTPLSLSRLAPVSTPASPSSATTPAKAAPSDALSGPYPSTSAILKTGGTTTPKSALRPNQPHPSLWSLPSPSSTTTRQGRHQTTISSVSAATTQPGESRTELDPQSPFTAAINLVTLFF